MRFLRSEAKTIFVAMITAAVTAGGPVIAATVANADKVDGKHAVGSKASLTQAAGKLVATAPRGANKGRIPGKFIGKVASATKADSALNANSLGGQPASSYLGDTLNVVSTDLAGNNAVEGHTVSCPAGYTAVGGGVDTGTGGTTLVVAASAPSIETDTTPDHPSNLADGQHGKATGWYGAVANTTGGLALFKVAVTCARD